MSLGTRWAKEVPRGRGLKLRFMMSQKRILGHFKYETNKVIVKQNKGKIEI
jgi:hypothetical protein